ncbi:anti-sigma factor [Lutimaribacter sp. EGI FJ00015]|uniref:Anti-sigma factor n=1 Tax=Lutimaribacter degradans TaxID=2945989 RepID=A0ACC5ZSG0_9RHOB|nr:anti-sigma factor [Lutimaribacter sp. EGI FJ00013]MCM2560721.1 anti-sigma factor [Lutimaribacter sp. EGI FJ00013]MCO0612334.1 anti-sigma factor [Lutimaribacter sp. EGI FJ00015]MCO0634546.1 anti-sigma factor [Lutimaribacter sp. EGI FJ00014]
MSSDRPDILPQGGADDALAAEYALGLLSEAEARDFEERLVHEPALRAIYARWAEHFAAMTDPIAPVEPPARLRARVMRQVAPRHGGAGLRRLLGWLAGAAAGAVLGAAVLLLVGPVGDLPGLRADIAAPDGALVIGASYAPASGRLTVTRQSGQAAPGRALELWMIAGDAAPVSLGVLPDADSLRLDVPAALREALAPGAVLAVSDEPPGGSPTGQPTGAVLATGVITES